MLDFENVKKIAKRIKDSKRFDENWISNRIYFFDDQLTIECYNGLYKIDFKGQTLGHLHGRGRDEKLHDIIYYAIKEKKRELKNKAFQEL